MKWVKMPGDPRSVDDEIRFIFNEAAQQQYPKQDPEREKKIKAFREKVDAMCNRNHDAGFKERSQEWVKHEFTGYFDSETHFKLFRVKYENFIGGYLWYYDNILRSQAVDHGMRFEWKHVKDDVYSVAIFLDPPPAPRFSGNIPLSKKLKSHATASLPEDEGLSVDPPKPPPPPPPSM
jgi:hypothetical protein